MKNKYLWLTPIVAAAHKIFITGFYQNEIAHGKLIPIVVNTLTFSALVFAIPFIITIINSIKTKQFSWTLMNKMTLYALVLYIAVLILPEIYTKKMIKSINQQTTERKSDQLNVNNEIPWFRNAFYSFSVSTPEKMTHVDGVTMPKGYEKLFNDVQIFLYQSKTSVVQLMYFDSNLESYDLEEGLKSGIGNHLNLIKATNLNLQFVNGDFENPSLYFDGDFLANGQKVLIKGMGYFNGGKSFNLVCYAFGDTTISNEFLDRVMTSIRIIE